MSTYLIHETYHRQVDPLDLDLLIDGGNSLVLMNPNGEPVHVQKPVSEARKTSVEEQRKMWTEACAAGRVYYAWALRWTTSEELRPLAPLNEQPADVPAEAIVAKEGQATTQPS